MDIIYNASENIWDENERNLAVSAFSKFFWIQNDTFLKPHAISQSSLIESYNAKLLSDDELQQVEEFTKSENLLCKASGVIMGFGLGAIISVAISRAFK
ncbi:hypothetical protein AYI68_g3206 [Smittium mucronatum]|uniref:Uncharacterized protein n=1 Tax=Smittium mucronatum TaxID=133383 RepID=A0A1R0H0K9_9FUNG|nr:hypothetical protein AYI68_g3206 [Smittium mucronatum]